MSLNEVAKSRLGRVLRNKYHLVRVLGIGGMATVYEAEHRNRRRFAVKILHPELSLDEGIRTRFLREGYVANSVGHRGAVAVLDDDVAEDGSAFLVMELLDGASLEQLHEQHGMVLPVTAVLAVASQLLEILAAAHKNGIVHRDLKPANLFVTHEGNLQVLDFGIARLLDGTAGAATQTGQTLGTPAFMPPEQAFGKPSELDGQADLWAVGATLFILLSGHYVHESSTTQELLVALVTKPARSIASVVPNLPPAVARLVDGALITDKQGRWANAAAMQDALQLAWAAVDSPSARADTKAELARLFADPPRPQAPQQAQSERRRSPLFASSIFVLLLIIVGLSAALAFGYRQGGDVHEVDATAEDAPERTGSAPEARPRAPASLPVVAPTATSGGDRNGRAAPAHGASHIVERGIDPRAVVPLAKPAGPLGAPRPSNSTSPACTLFLERLSLGEELSAEERAVFAGDCRK